MNINFLVILLFFVITLPFSTSTGRLDNCLETRIIYYSEYSQDNYEWNGDSYSTKQDALNAIDNHYPGGVIVEKNSYTTNGRTNYNVEVCIEIGATQSKATKTTQFPPRSARYSNKMYSNKEIGDTIKIGITIPNPVHAPYYRRRK
uniref:Secreted protein n=1 Tax=Parastrongyloides trichosuri TaxID=131310 RepID=A0A0N4Z2T6_PARTI